MKLLEIIKKIFTIIKFVYLAIIELSVAIGPFFTSLVIYFCTDSIIATISNFILCVILPNLYLEHVYQKVYSKIKNYKGSFNDYLNEFLTDKSFQKQINSYNFDVFLFYLAYNMFLFVFAF